VRIGVTEAEPSGFNWKRERERECVKVPLPGESQLNADLVI
jgi:hypothetical protein